jgi:hypothetical protein
MFRPPFHLEFNTYVESEVAAGRVGVEFTEQTLKVITVRRGLRVDERVALVRPGEEVVGKQ